MKTGIAFAAIPKFNTGLSSTLGVSGVASIAGSIIMFGQFGVTGLLATVTATAASTSYVGITSSRRRVRMQQERINSVLESVIHTETRITPSQVRRLLGGGTITFDQGEAETLEISYLEQSGEETRGPGDLAAYTGLISIECNRNTMDAVNSFDSVLLSLAEQDTTKVLNAAQTRKIYATIKNSRAERRSLESKEKYAA